MTDAIDRRRFVAGAGAALASLALGDACSASMQSADDQNGRLTARPRETSATTLVSGPLGLSTDGRDGLVRMPAVRRDGKVPLLLFLHGAGQNGERMLARIGESADQQGLAIVAPDSRGQTWDAIRGRFGPDVAFLNRVLEHVFSRLDVDPTRVALGGFSDGASYALSLGLVNGDLFRRVLACSPGFVMPAPVNGRARFFVSHGTSDPILPIDECSRVIVPRLKGMGYDVTYREFDGRHEMPPAIVNEALAWVTA